MSNVYLARHTESLNNERKIFGGVDVAAPLTPKGREQAEELAARFRAVSLDVVLCGSALRHIETAAPLVAQQDGLVVHMDPNLNERDHGNLNGTSYVGIHDVIYFLYHNENRECGEPLSAVHARATMIHRKLTDKLQGKEVFVMSSGFFTTVLCAVLEGVDIRYRQPHVLANGHYHHYELTDAGVFVPRGYNL